MTSSARGYKDTLTIDLTIGNGSHTSVDVNACSSYTWTTGDGNIYNTSGSYDYITTNATGCKDTLTLNLTIGTGGHTHVAVTSCGSYTWTTGDGNTYNTSGSYDYITTNATGCKDRMRVDQTMSDGSHTSVDVNACSSYTWTTGNGNTYNTSGSYYYITTNATGCKDTVTLNLTIGIGGHTHVAVTSCGSYTWTTGDGNTYNTSGSYDYITTNATGCMDTLILDLTIYTINLTITNPSTVCSPNTVDLTTAAITAGSDPGLIYTYWTDNGATVPLANPTNVATGGTYYIKASSGAGCTVIKPVIVTINIGPAPNVITTDPAQVCAPATVDLTDPTITAGSDPGLTYSYWTDAANTIPVPDPKAVSISGTYYITGTAVGGCSSTKSVQVIVKVNKATPPMRYPTVTTRPNTPVQLSARDLNSSVTYLWQPPIGLN